MFSNVGTNLSRLMPWMPTRRRAAGTGNNALQRRECISCHNDFDAVGMLTPCTCRHTSSTLLITMS